MDVAIPRPTSVAVSKILTDVRIAIDENMPGSLPVDEKTTDSLTLDLDKVIESKIVECVKQVEMAAPLHKLESGHNFSDNGIAWNGDGSGIGFVQLPVDFMRLLAFKMKGWSRAVYAPITPESPLYARQSSKCKGLRGTPTKPVCAIGYKPYATSNGRVLEFYSCKDNTDTIEYARYLPMPVISGGNIEICKDCYRAVVYSIAAATLLTFGEADKATALTELAKAAL